VTEEKDLKHRVQLLELKTVTLETRIAEVKKEASNNVMAVCICLVVAVILMALFILM
jgi:hypothetical protein